MLVLLLMAFLCIVSVHGLAKSVDARPLLATMSTQLGESPPFPCDPDRTSLSYQPFGANATTLPVGANICKVVGARIVGDYLTDNGTASLLV